MTGVLPQLWSILVSDCASEAFARHDHFVLDLRIDKAGQLHIYVRIGQSCTDR